MIVMDWQRGKIPFFVAPPDTRGKTESTNNVSAETADEDKNKEVFLKT